MMLGSVMIALAPLLIALGLGYVVLYFAKKEGGNLKIVGYVIGTSIIVLSVILIIISFVLSAKLIGLAKRGMPGMGGMMPSRQGAMMPPQGNVRYEPLSTPETAPKQK